MNKYIGKICPYCKSALTEDDEIVVCSNCEMPHHKDCWVDNQGCTTFGCSGTIQGIDIEVETIICSAPNYKVRDVVSVAEEQPSFCGKCGAQLIKGSSFCGKCGAPILKITPSTQNNHYSQKISHVKSKISSGIKNAMSEFQINDFFDNELELYIGSKQEYYRNKFSEFKTMCSYVSWNWFAFLFSPFWCLYRKMYIAGGIILGLDFVLALIGGFFSGLLMIGIAFVVGLFADYFYMYDLEQRMKKGKDLQGIQKSRYIEKYGGVTIVIPSVCAIICALLCIIIFVK